MDLRRLAYLPNVITGIRILLAPVLLFTEPLGAAFMSVYMLCGLTDAIDGLLARRLNLSTALGAKLDSLADALLTAVILFVLLPRIDLSGGLLAWIAAIGAVRGLSLIVVYWKHREFAFLHTYANKATGFLLFCFPIMYFFWGSTLSTAVVCAGASVSSAEELWINLRSKILDRNIKSSFSLK